MTADVALSHSGLTLGLQVSRLTRNNADWYLLLDLCAMSDTLIGDADVMHHSSCSTNGGEHPRPTAVAISDLLVGVDEGQVPG